MWLVGGDSCFEVGRLQAFHLKKGEMFNDMWWLLPFEFFLSHVKLSFVTFPVDICCLDSAHVFLVFGHYPSGHLIRVLCVAHCLFVRMFAFP